MATRQHLELEPCCPVLGEAPRYTPREAEEVTITLKAIADPARVAIVSLLAGRDDRRMTTREIAPLVELSEPTVSHHLKKLEAAGIVSPQRDGARVLYHLNVHPLQELALVLNVSCTDDADCC